MILKLIHKTTRLIAQALFPRECLECRQPEKYFCLSCLQNMPIPPSYTLEHLDIVIAAAFYHYSGIKKAVRQLKYRHSRDLAHELAGLMAGALQRNRCSFVKNPDSLQIIPIPITKKRKRWRGFNQAEELARELAGALNLPFCAGLIKIQETRPQTEIKNRKERLENIKGAFIIKSGYQPANTVILVDDISTTGATLNEAARVLKNAGAKKVIGVVVAKG